MNDGNSMDDPLPRRHAGAAGNQVSLNGPTRRRCERYCQTDLGTISKGRYRIAAENIEVGYRNDSRAVIVLVACKRY